MQLSAWQRRAVLAAGVALLAVGLAPWPDVLRGRAGGGAAPEERGKCPLGFEGGAAVGELPPGHPPVSPHAAAAASESAYAPPLDLTFDAPAPLEATSAEEAALLGWMGEQRASAEALLEALVNTDSGTHNKAGVDAVATTLLDWLHRSGVEAERVPQAVVGDHVHARVRCGVSDTTDADAPPPKRVLLLGHMDTVYADGAAASRPFARSADGTRASGPGVSDMKDGLVAASLVLAAAQRFGCAGAPGPLLLEALFTSDEEVGSVVSRSGIIAAARGATAVFNMESGSASGAVAAARKASLTLTFALRGVAAHAGNAPHEGASAIEAFARKTLRMHALNDYRVGVSGVKGVDGVTISVGTVAGGTAPNVVPDRVTATVNARAWSAARVSALNATLRGIIEDASDVKGTTGEVIHEALFPPFEQTPARCVALCVRLRVYPLTECIRSHCVLWTQRCAAGAVPARRRDAGRGARVRGPARRRRGLGVRLLHRRAHNLRGRPARRRRAQSGDRVSTARHPRATRTAGGARGAARGAAERVMRVIRTHILICCSRAAVRAYHGHNTWALARGRAPRQLQRTHPVVSRV
jgi:glutamate carboxypeptidase